MMNEVSKFIAIFFGLLIGFILVLLPGLIFLWVWAALRAVGIGVLWILLVIIGIFILMSLPIFNTWRNFTRYFSGMC